MADRDTKPENARPYSQPEAYDPHAPVGPELLAAWRENAARGHVSWPVSNLLANLDQVERERDAERARAEAAEAELVQATRMLDAQTEGAQAGDAGLGPEANPYPIDEPGAIGPATMWEVARLVAANHRSTEAALAELLAAVQRLATTLRDRAEDIDQSVGCYDDSRTINRIYGKADGYRAAADDVAAILPPEADRG